MDAKDIRNLQKAYMEIVMNELDESRGDDLRTKYRLKPGEVSARLFHMADRKTFKYERNDPRRAALSDLSGLAIARSDGNTDLHKTGERVKRGGRPSGTTIHTHADRDRGDKGERFSDFVAGKRDSPNMSDTERRTVNYGRTSRHRREQVDLYDLILSHLLDEGYADTVENAEVIMVNMSEEWRDDIVEGWKPADTAKMSYQAYKLEKQGDPHYKVLDAAIKNLSASNTKQPSSKNVISRNLQLARLKRGENRAHGEIVRHGSTSDMKNPEVQKKVIKQAKTATDNTVKQKIIKTIGRMQTKRTPSEQQKQSAVNRFDRTFHN